MSTDATPLSLDLLTKAVQGSGAALRMRARLQPAGGPGDKVFPPTYAEGQDGKKHETRYASEQRVIDGERKPTVLLDSVASQANRMELALLEARRRGQASVPLIAVDFRPHFPDLGLLSTLEAPHRVYDAIMRDSTLGGEAFRASTLGRQLTETNTADARSMLAHCPTALLFGAWDSTGPRGGMGNKFQRALVSEVVGVDFEAGAKVASRIDPLQSSASVRLTIPKENSDDWSVDESGKSKQRPSEVNHSNIAPTRDEESGGVTFTYALHTAVLSLPALRRLRFGDWSDAQTDAARTLLAALGVLCVVLQRREGYDFRSRCSLVPEGPARLELVSAEGSVEALSISVDEAFALYAEAVNAAKAQGVDWAEDEVHLEPMPKLIQLITASREAYRAGTAEEA
ncbi:type I-U CRISPR-associated protein Cas7 [Pseudenhygromyxa sp. WMMC2535]|uniref:type I-G CRISPR-associated RAMP protein Csb1/Cas7g n=1 Tax=Pseudenhygromyxa sp. WMMC2535 TaxID=2712867 RepID=UPI00155349E9|nr:type I-U CRISPR-associated RAMP protein Csb1/Cas7u [Pseudenhygromyxa sp. WMMC2535]NVB39799.1 type I-U CRISPR-associated protein Cas7 [Pseudenhygromyxa sp. WMMC2535]